MRAILMIVLLSVALQATASYTEFYCIYGTGTNVNSGDTVSGTATYSAANGNWDGTSVYIPTDGTNPEAAGVVTNTFASVYLDGATNGVYIARIIAVTNAVNGGIVLDTTAKAGSAPSSSATGRSIKVGGCWNGPYAGIPFPFNFVTATLTNFAGDYPCVNVKSGTTYAITSGITHSLAGPIRWQGYSSSVRDGGKATIDCATSGTGVTIFTLSGINNDFADFILSNSGATSGSTDGLVASGNECTLARVVVHDVRRSGIAMSGTGGIAVECEAYACNKANTSGNAGISLAGSGNMGLRCISHDNTGGNNANGFIVSGTGSSALFCVADSNSGYGFNVLSTTATQLISCDAYNNTLSGIDLGGASAMLTTIQNCNLVKNTTYGISTSGSSIRNGSIYNCGFGSGTMTNGSGSIAVGIGGILVVGSVLYNADQTPWVDPVNGDFRITLANSKGAGRGLFTETQVSYTGTVAYPDIGAGQGTSVQSGGGNHSYTFGQ